MRDIYATPTFVYDEASLRQSATECLNFPAPFGLTVRYAMKANSNAVILQLFERMGIHIDAASTYEAERAMMAGIDPEKICISSQELEPAVIQRLMARGVHVDACSLHQLEMLGRLAPGSQIGVRFNPGVGSGSTSKTNVGGPSSSFGIWHEFKDQVKEIAAKYDLQIVRIHTHIGSGSDPAVWQRVAHMTLDLVRDFPSVHTVNLGGGFKVARMPNEKHTNMQQIGKPIKAALEEFAKETGRRLHLEIEPGTYLVANAGSLVTSIVDIVQTTGPDGHEFIKVNSGMPEIMRPALYGAQHPIVVVPRTEQLVDRSFAKYVVVGRCCESGDLLTPAPQDSETIAERYMLKAEIGDLCVVEGAGAYCSSMSARNYNSYPAAAEVLLRSDGIMQLIRRRQNVKDIVELEDQAL